MKVKLRSNFYDYYDPYFDLDGVIFERFSTGGMGRREMFEYLKSLGLKVPFYGTPQEVADRFEHEVFDGLKFDDVDPKDLAKFKADFLGLYECVVHTDERAHQGEGKLRMPVIRAVKEYPDVLASEFINPALPRGVFRNLGIDEDHQAGFTLRYLSIGDKVFWLLYSSKEDWRSNCGQVDVRVICQEKDQFHPRIHYPLWAVDFVPSHPHLYAVDFNIAPQVRGTGVENLLSAKEAAEAIKQAIEHFSAQGEADDAR